MTLSLKDLVDVPKLQELTDQLYLAARIPSAIVTTDGEILTRSGWQRICTEFHRQHPETEKDCIASNIAIRENLAENEPFSIYVCPRGLTEATIPITIEGEHLANAFVGQLFLEAPDMAIEQRFRATARQFGLDEAAYMEAFGEIPVISKERFHSALFFLAKVAEMVAQQGLIRKRELATAERLHESQMRLSRIGDNLPGAYTYQYAHDAQGRPRFLFVSEGVARIHGFTPEALMRDPSILFAQIPSEHLEIYLRAESESKRDCSDFTSDIPFVMPTGQWRWLNVRSHPIKRPDGSIVWDGVATDVTQRKQGEEALRISEERYRRLFETMTQGVVHQDAEGRIFSANPAAQRILGLSFDQMRGKTSLDPQWRCVREDGSVLPGDQHPSMVALKSGQPVEHFVMGVFNPLRKAVSWLSISAIPIFKPGETRPYQVYTIFDDITAKRQAEEDFKTLFREMLEGFALHEIICDESGKPINYRFLAVNPAFERTTGLKASDIVGKTVLEAIPDIERRWIEIYGKVALSGEPAFFESYTESLKKHFEVTAFRPLANRFVCIFNDVTERKKKDEALLLNETRLRSLVSIMQHRAVNPQEFLDYALDEAIKLSNSKIGYIYHYSEEAQEFVLNTWSKGVMSQCAIEAQSNSYQLEKTGIWGEAVRQRKPIIVNDFMAPNPQKKGYPEGHAPLKSFLTIPIFKDGKIIAVLGVANKSSDYTDTDVLQLTLLLDGVFRELERVHAAESLRESEERHRVLFEMSHDALLTVEPPDWRFTACNRATLEMFKLKDEEDFKAFAPHRMSPLRQPDGRESAEKSLEMIETALREGSHFFEWQHVDRNGEPFPAEVLLTRMERAGQPFLHASLRNIAQRKQAEEEKAKLEMQLQQAMKMEAVGRLAGGVAHDFNNLLTGITGNVDLALMDLQPSDPLAETLREVNKAAASAVALTRQLLAFSRKQIIEPRLLNLNEIITSLQKMLGRLISENIELKTILFEPLDTVKIDPGQFEQILVNLAINARDAMPDGGLLLIETANVELDDAYCQQNTNAAPGGYVRLAVSDSGQGMSEEAKKHLFEPFFTTKPKGRGTGLGLATIYGAAKQAGGFIEVYSELAVGTTFKLYFPRAAGQAERLEQDARPSEMPCGSETILLVEDEEIVRDLATRILRHLGYTVLHSQDGGHAFAQAANHKDRIDLLMTDVVMPGMNGRQLAERLIEIHPEMRILYTSGYTEDVIVHHGVVEAHLNFIGKPYTPQTLAKKLREVLERPAK